jgi:hypothetical protein
MSSFSVETKIDINDGSSLLERTAAEQVMDAPATMNTQSPCQLIMANGLSQTAANQFIYFNIRY